MSAKMMFRVDRKIAMMVIEIFTKIQKILINCENFLQVFMLKSQECFLIE
jgi:hypothetical protein